MLEVHGEKLKLNGKTIERTGTFGKLSADEIMYMLAERLNIQMTSNPTWQGNAQTAIQKLVNNNGTSCGNYKYWGRDPEKYKKSKKQKSQKDDSSGQKGAKKRAAKTDGGSGQDGGVGVINREHLDIKHCSSGIGPVDGCTLFYVTRPNNTAVIIGIGYHVGAQTYDLDWEIGHWSDNKNVCLDK